MGGDVDIKKLEKNNMFSIIMYLYRNGRCLKSSLYSVFNTSLLPQKIDYLIEKGLVSEDRQKFNNNAKYLELTDLGKSIASRIEEIEQLMGGIIEGPESNHIAPEVERDTATGNH